MNIAPCIYIYIHTCVCAPKFPMNHGNPWFNWGSSLLWWTVLMMSHWLLGFVQRVILQYVHDKVIYVIELTVEKSGCR